MRRLLHGSTSEGEDQEFFDDEGIHYSLDGQEVSIVGFDGSEVRVAATSLSEACRRLGL